MNSQNPAQEPTMEEILASIRRIISEDSGTGEVKAAPGAKPAPAAEQAPPPAFSHDEDEEEAEAIEAEEALQTEDFVGDEIGFEDPVLELTEALPDEEPEPVSFAPAHTPENPVHQLYAVAPPAEPQPVDESEILMNENSELPAGHEDEPVVHFMPEPLESYEETGEPETYESEDQAPQYQAAEYQAAEFSGEFEEHEDIAFEEPAMTVQTPTPVQSYAAPPQAHQAPVAQQAAPVAYQAPVHDAEPASLLSSEAASAASAAFGTLTNSLMHAQGGGKTLEEIVTEMLRPMLKEWLDDNLPNMVENLVRAEIERISRRTR